MLPISGPGGKKGGKAKGKASRSIKVADHLVALCLRMSEDV